MASHIQTLIYEGFLGTDPEMRYTQSGQAVVNFNLGSTRQYKTQAGEVVSKTTWLRVSAWGKLAEIVNQYCGKGSHVIVQGALNGDDNGRPPAYMTKDNKPSASFDVTANEVRIIKGKDGQVIGTNTAGGNLVTAPDDDIPF